MKRFKAVILDLGGVLSVGKKEEFAEGVHEFVSRKLDISLDQYLDSIDTTYADAISGKISGRKALKDMAKNLNVSPDKLKKVYMEAYRKNFKRDEKLYQFVLKLKKKGYKISIISDIWEIAKEALIDRRYSRFDDVVTSCDVGSRKTNTKIFRVALKRLNVNPKEAIFTDNQKWNLVSPRKLGITPVWYRSRKQFIKELKKRGITV